MQNLPSTSSIQATAQVFVTALKALPQATQNQVILEIIQDKQLREDLIDLTIAEDRSRESSRPLKKFFLEIDKGNVR